MQWAKIRLTTQQVATREIKLLSARRTIGAELAPTIKTVLTQVDSLLTAKPSKQNRAAAISIVNGLTSRYAQLGRHDLVSAVIDSQLTGAADDAKAKQLDDWALWMKAHFVGQRANLALSEAVVRAEDVTKLPIDPLHKTELDLLNQLVTKHPSSDYAGVSVNAVLRIAATYENNRAYDAGRLVLTNFLKAQPKLNQAIDFEYRVISITLSEAAYAFSQREDATKPPENILPEHVRAIESLGAFLKSHPTGDYSPIAVNELFAIARHYGEVGAWPVTRDIIKRFAALVPDFRSPNRLKLLEAATYLGQLDQQRGLNLLVATPAPQPASKPTNNPGDPFEKNEAAQEDTPPKGGSNRPDDADPAQTQDPEAAKPALAAAPYPGTPGRVGFGVGLGYKDKEDGFYRASR